MIWCQHGFSRGGPFWDFVFGGDFGAEYGFVRQHAERLQTGRHLNCGACRLRVNVVSFSTMRTNRREFLKDIALATGVGISAGGCASASASAANGGEGGAPMRNFACSPLKRVRVGVVGTGARGGAAVTRLPKVPGVEVVAVCDIRPEFAARAARAVEDLTGRRPAVYDGSAEAYKRLQRDFVERPCARRGVRDELREARLHRGPKRHVR